MPYILKFKEYQSLNYKIQEKFFMAILVIYYCYDGNGSHNSIMHQFNRINKQLLKHTFGTDGTYG